MTNKLDKRQYSFNSTFHLIFSKMLQIYGPLLGIYAIPNLENYMSKFYNIQFGIALFLWEKDFLKTENLSLMSIFQKVFLNHVLKLYFHPKFFTL